MKKVLNKNKEAYVFYIEFVVSFMCSFCLRNACCAFFSRLFALFSPAVAPLLLGFPMLWHRLFCVMIGLRVRYKGYPFSWKDAVSQPTLFVSNHIGLQDIPVLGAFFPLSFVAKKEIRSWPFCGFLARLQRTIFVERKSTKVMQQCFDLLSRFKEGASLVFFPEGTTSDASHVLPFKSSLFQVCPDFNKQADRPIQVVPVCLAYTHYNGQPVKTTEDRDRVSFPDHISMLSHIKSLLLCRRIDVTLYVHEPFSSLNKSRKEICAQAYCCIHKTFHDLTGQKEKATAV